MTTGYKTIQTMALFFCVMLTMVAVSMASSLGHAGDATFFGMFALVGFTIVVAMVWYPRETR